MIFLWVNICWVPRRPADVNVSERHGWSLLLHKIILSLENVGENASKIFFPVPIMARKGKLPVNVLKTPLPKQMITSV